MPLIVYLDTQDYINLFNEPDDGPNHEVLSKLIAYRDRGEIVMGFSFAIILEFITRPTDEHREERVRRGQLIKDICGPNAFPYITDSVKGATFPNGGMWMASKSDKIVSAKKFRRDMQEMVAEELAKTGAMNRQLRRKILRKGGVAELVRAHGGTWRRKRSDYGDFPVSDEIVESRVMERFIKGQCSDAELEERMNRWILDPAEFSRIAYDYADKPNMIDDMFGKNVRQIEQAMQSMQEAHKAVEGLNVRSLELRQKLLDAGLSKSEAKKLTKEVSMPPPDPSRNSEKLEAAFGKERSGHFQHYFARASKPGYRFKRSDAMDVIQMCYVYDCDLFRCDKDMANTFRDYEPFNGKLVKRFADLPDRIADKLSDRDCCLSLRTSDQ